MEIIWLSNRKSMRRTLQALFLGQLISLVLAVMSFTASLVANLGVDTPLTLSFFSYLVLTLVYGSILVYRHQKLMIPWYWYLFLGFVDVHGNYLVNKAYQYSSITSVTILDCWTIAWVIILTWLFLGARYSLRQFFGAAICLLGLGLVLLSDAGVGGGGGTKPVMGDTLVIAGTFFFAMSNVGEEFCVKKKDLVEVVSMIGLFGMLVSILAFAGYALTSFMFYTFVPFVLKHTTSTPTTSDPQPTETQSPSLPSAPPSSLQQSSLTPPSSSILPSSPNPNPKPPTSQSQQQPSLQNSQSRPPFNRPSHFAQFSSSPSPPSISSLPPPPRGGMAIGVPATPPPTFSSPNPVPPPPFGQQFSALARNSVNIPDSGPSSSTSQVRQPMQPIRGMGIMGSLGSTSPMRPGGVPAQHQQRPVQSSLRPQISPNNQSPATQNFQGHSLLRVPSVGSPGSSLPSTSMSSQPHNQPWLPSGSQGKPPLPSPSYRPQLSPQSVQQRSHIPQQHHLPMTNAQQQQQTPSGQQSQSSLSHQPQEHYGQQFPSSRIQQSLPHQQVTRVQGLGNQKLSSQAMIQPSAIQTVLPSAAATAEPVESCNRILSKRSIQELVTQIDPSEKLDPEVEDILVDIADEFVESITTFGCSLAKHRKSNTLEAKDILVHLERNWNMTLPGFSGDEIKGYRKLAASDIHRERLAVIKRSMVVTEITNTKSSASQASGNAKGHLKAPANIIGSPNPKIREAA